MGAGTFVWGTAAVEVVDTCDGAFAAGAAPRSVIRVSGTRDGEGATTGGRTRAVCDRGGVTTAGSSAWRVTVPLRLKFWSSLGPTVTVVEFEVGDGVGVGVGAVWASARAGANVAATNAAPPRKIAFIRSRFSSDRRFVPRQRASANARRVPNIQALGR